MPVVTGELEAVQQIFRTLRARQMTCEMMSPTIMRVAFGSTPMEELLFRSVIRNHQDRVAIYDREEDLPATLQQEEEVVASQQAIQNLTLSFNRSQFPELTRRATSAEKQLRDLFLRAGLEGEIRISLIRQRVGSPHTQGIKLSRYDQSGVLLTVQSGGNDSRIEMNVHPPQGIDASTLHKRLKEILEPAEEETTNGVEEEMQQEEATETPVEASGETQETPMDRVEGQETIAAAVAEEGTSTNQPTLLGFTHDRDQVRLLQLEIEARSQESRRGFFTSKQMTEIFSRLLGYSVKPSALGPILKSLSDRGDLMRSGTRTSGYRYSLNVAASVPSSTVSLHGFAEDEERISLLIAQIEELQREIGQDFLTGSQLTEAVRRVVGQPISGKTTSGIRRILVERGQLEVAGDRHNRTYRLKSAMPSVEPAVPSGQAQVPSTSLVDQIRERAVLAREWEEADREGRELDARLAELEAQAIPIRARLEELRPMRENSQARQAAEEVAEIRRELLGG